MAVVLVGAQWGDEGKGKITDYLAGQADMVVRYQGGANAGHTVVMRDTEHRLHLVPSGLTAGCEALIGNGVVVDPDILLKEMNRLSKAGFDLSLLRIAETAHVVMPYHKLLDQYEEELRSGHGQKVGTTGRGIGPAYADKVARKGIRMIDLMDRDYLGSQLEIRVSEAKRVLEEIPFTVDSLIRQYSKYGELFGDYLCDASLLVFDALQQGKQVLFEGAQGTMLDIDHGTYPYVTSSSPVAGGACSGTGVGPTQIGRVIGVVKAYVSRVGAGPFPTELEGKTGEWLRNQGKEYGTTTGRPRRCGWLDGVLLKYAVRINGLDGLCLTKLDVLQGLKEINIARTYEFEGQSISEFPHDRNILNHCQPIYESVPGWDVDISNCKDFEELPAAAREFVGKVEEIAGIPVVMISVGPKRSQTIHKEKVLA